MGSQHMLSKTSNVLYSLHYLPFTARLDATAAPQQSLYQKKGSIKDQKSLLFVIGSNATQETIALGVLQFVF